MIKYLFFLSFILLQFALEAQELDPRFKTYSSKDGLSQNVVNTIFQDRKNYIWLGTQDGLNRFDGFNFKVFRFDPEDSASISDNWINRIFMEDADGDIWMVTGDWSINIYNPRLEQFNKLSLAENVPKKNAHAEGIYMILQDKAGFIWISSNRGLFKVNKLNWHVEDILSNSNSKEKPRLFSKFYEDRNQNLWFYSNRGLLVYSTKLSKIIKDTYAENPQKEILPVIAVFGDQTNSIWVYTTKKILQFNSSFQSVKTISFDHLVLPAEVQKDIKLMKAVFPFVKATDDDNYWIGTYNGLVHFNLKSQTVKGYLPGSAINSISGSEITSIFKDRADDIWVGTTKGLNRFNKKEQNFTRIGIKPGSEALTGIREIFEDKSGNVWVIDLFRHGDGFHLAYVDKEKMQLVQTRNNPSDPNSLPTDYVFRPFTDNDNNSWLGTFGSGVTRFAPFQKKFRLLEHKNGVANSLEGESVWAIAEDLQGRLWVSLHKDGIDCYDPSTNTFTHYTEKLRKYLKVSNVNIISLVCDKQNTLWIGTMGLGVVAIDLKTNRMKHYYAGTESPNPISDNSVAAISLDNNGNVLISYSAYGFDILDPITGKYRNFVHQADNSNSLVNNSVRTVIQDSNGCYWASTDGAISKFDPVSGKMTHYLSKRKKGKGIIAEKASCIFEDSKKRIWVGTHGGGLSLFDPKRDMFLYWTEKDGLVNNVVYGILEDSTGKLWLSTNNGLSCFDPASEKFVNYYENDGLQSGEFNANSYFKSEQGILYFGGIQGITYFDPSQIVPDQVSPKVSITGFQVYNRKLEVIPSAKADLIKKNSSGKLIEDGGELYLPCNISYANELIIDYEHKVITFEFAALKFDMPERCTFMYRMEGFEDDWNIAGNRRFATYTNLPPGDYIFKVTAANADGVYNPEPASIKIVIKPPFYLTWWFISFCIASLIVASTSFVMKREKHLKRTKSILEEKVKLRTHELNEKNEELMLRNIQILKQKEEIANQAKRLRFELDVQNQTSEQALLRSQINPHFLFNTLNNIYSLVYQKAENAPEALMKLSDIMRYMLYDTSADMVFLDKEVQYLRSFIELHQLRLKSKDFVSFEVVGDPSGKQIAPMLLIAFVENAFKHGNKSVPSPGIQILLDCSGDRIKFEVKNFKNPSAAKDSLGGIGLTNVKRRLELIYHEKYKLNIQDLCDKFEVDLIIKATNSRIE